MRMQKVSDEVINAALAGSVRGVFTDRQTGPGL